MQDTCNTQGGVVSVQTIPPNAFKAYKYGMNWIQQSIPVFQLHDEHKEGVAPKTSLCSDFQQTAICSSYERRRLVCKHSALTQSHFKSMRQNESNDPQEDQSQCQRPFRWSEHKTVPYVDIRLRSHIPSSARKQSSRYARGLLNLDGKCLLKSEVCWLASG